MATSAPPLPDPATPLPDPPKRGPDQPVEVVRGLFEPPSGLVLTAIVRNKLIVLAAAVVCAVGGAAYGLSRPHTYTASATLQIGQVNPNSPGFYSYVQSAAALAVAFSRAIYAEPVLATVQHELKLAPASAVGRLTASPIPQSPTLRVTATGPTVNAAVKLANVGANALVAYEGQSNSANPEAGSLLQEYREASLHLRNVEAKLDRRARALSHEHAPTSLLAPDEAEKNAAQIKLKAIGVAYTAAVSSQAPRSGLVTLLAGAEGASSNHKAKAEQLGFIGLLVGVLAGCLVAVVRERRRGERLLGTAISPGISKPV